MVCVCACVLQLAGFRCTPNKGRLQPQQSANVVVTFCPGQMGVYKKTLHIVIGDGLVTVPVRLSGSSSSTGAKKTASMGVNLPASALKPTYNFVPQDSTLDADNAASFLAESGFEGSTVVDTSTPAKRGPWVRPKPWEKLLKEDSVNLDTVPTDTKYTGTVRDLLQVRPVRQWANEKRCVFVTDPVGD